MSITITYRFDTQGRYRCMSNRMDIACTNSDTNINEMTFELSKQDFDLSPQYTIASFKVVKDLYGSFYKDFSRIVQRFLNYDFLVDDISEGVVPAIDSFAKFQFKVTDGTFTVNAFDFYMQNSFMQLQEWRQSAWTNYLHFNTDASVKYTLTRNKNNKIELGKRYSLHSIIYNTSIFKGFKITKYDLTDTAIGTGTMLYTIPANFNETSAVRVFGNVGTKDLIDYFGATFLDGVAKYKVEVEFLSGAVSSIPIWFTIVDYCGKYADIRLHWLNDLGGFDAFDFTKKAITTQSVSKQSYRNRDISVVNGVVTENVQLKTTNYVKRSNSTVINSDWCNDYEAQTIDELIGSRVVFAEINGVFYGCNVKTSSLVRKNINNDMLFNYELEIDIQDEQSTTI